MANTQCNDIDQICPESCDDMLVPSVQFSDCAPEINESEIEWLVVGHSETPNFTDIEDIDEWNQRISQTAPLAGPDNTLRLFRVTGDKPAPEDTEITISGQRTIRTGTTHIVNFDIDETNETNYEAIRKLQCNSTVKIWYITRACKVYGGICGMKAQFQARLIQNRGEGEIERYTGTVEWKDKIDPPRAEWPLCGTTVFPTPTT